MQDEFDVLLSELQTSKAVNYHLGGVMDGLLELHSPLEKKDERFKREFMRKFIKNGKPSLNAAMDHLDRFAYVIGNLEMAYQQLLDHPEMDLETQVGMESLARSHIINLKSLHHKQKETLTTITQVFLALSREHIKETGKKK